MKLKKNDYLESSNRIENQNSKIKLSDTIEIDPRKLKPNPANYFDKLPEDDYIRLKEDIAKRGIIDPIIIDESNVLLTGHNRLKISLELEMDRIPVRRVLSKLNNKDKEKLLILDNLNRRQLSPEEKRKFISIVYKDIIFKDNRGGDRKTKPTNDGFEKKQNNTAKIISSEIGISKRTAERIISEIKQSKPVEIIKKKLPRATSEIKLRFKELEIKIKQKEREINSLKIEYNKLKKSYTF
ncbi:MAG: ParB N-terminal domain-containing protein [Leptospiraceae bacterium]|nr:ParB N-terminal domain-containing protein [Leptospiraceae bacterium]